MSIIRKIGGLINMFIKKGYWYRHDIFQDCEKFWGYQKFNMDVVNLGSTSGLNAFDYEDLSLNCTNWAMTGKSLLGDLAILNNYISYVKPHDGVVIIPLCPFSSLAGRYMTLDSRFYTLLHPNSIPNFSYYEQQKVKKMMQRPISFYPMIAIITDFMHWIKKGKTSCVMSEVKMKEDAEKRMNNWMAEFSITDFEAPLSLVNQDGIIDSARLLNEIIGICKSHDLRPVVLIPPVYHTLAEEFNKEIRNVVIDSLVDRIEDKSIWFYNYMDDAQFVNDHSLFDNSFLLNKNGASLFTRRVLTDIKVLN